MKEPTSFYKEAFPAGTGIRIAGQAFLEDSMVTEIAC
jgi:hypothetical protein